MILNAKCQYCGIEFKYNSRSCLGKFCSRTCKINGSKKERIVKNCIICSKEFSFLEKQQRNNAKYCGRKCMGIGNTKSRPIHICRVCGIQYCPWSAKSKSCSKKCANKYTFDDMMLSLKERLQANAIRMNECLLWTKCKNNKGYGIIRQGKARSILAHRAAWLLHYNEQIPAGKMLIHSCDTPQCIEIKHLSMATAKDNTKDMLLKKREGTSKLTHDQIKEIRSLVDVIRTKELAKIYGVCKQTINRIKSGQSWNHI